MAQRQIRPVCNLGTRWPALVLQRSPEDFDAEGRTTRSRDDRHDRDRKPGGQAQRGGGSEEDHGLSAAMGLRLGASVLTQSSEKNGRPAIDSFSPRLKLTAVRTISS